MKRPVAKNSNPEELRESVAAAEVLFSMSQSEAQAIASTFNDAQRREFAGSFSAAVIAQFWRERASQAGFAESLRPGPIPPARGYANLLGRFHRALTVLAAARAEFLIGQLYTGLLPVTMRKTLGAFYTPVPLVERLFELTERAGLDWRTARVIDPACGGAAFLASVARRMLSAVGDRQKSPGRVLDLIEERLCGIEVDPFAAWMSMVLLDSAVIDITAAARRPLRPLVRTQDALSKLDPDLGGKFDLVIGNPPYGRVTLSTSFRERFKASLFGHANLYGLFTELAMGLAGPGALIAYVTPTSFLGGEYFKKLRAFLSREAQLEYADIVHNREGVFEGVLQETMLTVFRRRTEERTEARAIGRRVQVSVLEGARWSDPLQVEELGAVPLEGENGAPWILPRSRSDHLLIERLTRMPARVRDYGFEISTGQLVWNRHKPQLRAKQERGAYPIIWAEAVSADGTFHFQAARRGHLPFLKLERGQDFLLNHEPCILVQRTTAKEQKRRLIAAVIPTSFIESYPGYVVENHLNMIYVGERASDIALETIAALVNSAALDRVFRCISGSVAVSAYELNALPLPNPPQVAELQKAIQANASSSEIEILIAGFYSFDDSSRTHAAGHSGPEYRPVAA